MGEERTGDDAFGQEDADNGTGEYVRSYGPNDEEREPASKCDTERYEPLAGRGMDVPLKGFGWSNVQWRT